MIASNLSPIYDVIVKFNPKTLASDLGPVCDSVKFKPDICC